MHPCSLQSCSNVLKTFKKQHVLGVSFTFSKLDCARFVHLPGLELLEMKTNCFGPMKNGNHISHV